MRCKPFFPIVFLVVVGTTACGSTEQARSEGPRAARPSSGFEVGEPFPAVALPALEGGTPSSIADFRGKKVILHVFASW